MIITFCIQLLPTGPKIAITTTTSSQIGNTPRLHPHACSHPSSAEVSQSYYYYHVLRKTTVSAAAGPGTTLHASSPGRNPRTRV